jgi:hypothetical protein
MWNADELSVRSQLFTDLPQADSHLAVIRIVVVKPAYSKAFTLGFEAAWLRL